MPGRAEADLYVQASGARRFELVRLTNCYPIVRERASSMAQDGCVSSRDGQHFAKIDTVYGGDR